VAAYGFARWLGVWNALDSAAYVLQVAFWGGGYRLGIGLGEGRGHGRTRQASGQGAAAWDAPSAVAPPAASLSPPPPAPTPAPAPSGPPPPPPKVAITAVHLDRRGVAAPAFSVVLALQCLLLWAKIQYYTR
jgi:hypothetical protein